MDRFVFGFVVGTTLSVALVLIYTPKSGAETRQAIANRFHAALEAGRRARNTREQELWAEFRSRLKNNGFYHHADQHPLKLPSELTNDPFEQE